MVNEALKLLTVAEDLLVLAIGVVAQQDFAVLGPGVVLVDAFAWVVVFVGHGSRELWPGAGGENSLPYHITRRQTILGKSTKWFSEAQY